MRGYKPCPLQGWMARAQLEMRMHKPLTPKQQQQFDAAWKDLEENFEWKKVQRVMKYVGWEWHATKGVPNVEQIKELAKSLLRQLIQERGRFTGVGTGGLYASQFKNELGGKSYKLSFVLTSWET